MRLPITNVEHYDLLSSALKPGKVVMLLFQKEKQIHFT